VFDFLPCEKIRKTVECKPSCDHLVYYASQSPQIGAASNETVRKHLNSIDAGSDLLLVSLASNSSGAMYCGVPTKVFARSSVESWLNCTSLERWNNTHHPAQGISLFKNL
jgi:hypothetical protein